MGRGCDSVPSSGSQCGASSSHRSRTPERILTSSENQSMTLDVSIHKNFHIDLLHTHASISISNVASGRRGHIVVSNRLSDPSTLEIANADVVVNMAGPYTIPADSYLIMRYYGDLNILIVELFMGL